MANGLKEPNEKGKGTATLIDGVLKEVKGPEGQGS